MVFLHVLGTKQTFFRPKVAVCGMFIAAYQQHRGGQDSLGLDKFPGRSYRLILATIKAILRHLLQNLPPL